VTEQERDDFAEWLVTNLNPDFEITHTIIRNHGPAVLGREISEDEAEEVFDAIHGYGE
jgi:hypothetical protein